MYVAWRTCPLVMVLLMKQMKTETERLNGGLPLVSWNVLSQLSATQLKELDRLGVLRSLKKGDFVFRSGDVTGSVYFLKSGKVKVSQSVSNGKEVILWFCFGGDIFGLAEAVKLGDREVSAQACDASEVLCIPHENFNRFLFENPNIMFLLLQVMTSRLRCLSESLANVAGEKVSIRFARLMFWLCTRYGQCVGEGVAMNVKLTHQEIADMIGATRQTVTTLISKLKKEKVLEINNHTVHIIDKNRLCSLLH